MSVDEARGPILLLDGFSLVYRAFFALPPMTTQAGEPTSALYGFASLILKFLRQERPSGAVVALDGPAQTFRHVAFPAYKANRPSAPTPLGQQLRRLDELLDGFGFPSFMVPGFEADDVLATLAREVRAAGEQPLVVTGDLDALQCAIPPARVHVVARGDSRGRTYDEAAVWQRFGVSPAELPDWKALAGDPTDEIPGVPGVGGKTAAALVRRFGGIPGLLARSHEVTPARLQAAIEGHRELLPLWRDLARVRDDVPLPARPRWATLDAGAVRRLTTLFERLEFRSLIPRLSALEAPPA